MDYSQLLDDDILEKIVSDHLPEFSDRYHFSLVCKSWNSLALRRRQQRLPGLLSRLLDDDGIYQFLPFSMMGIAYCVRDHSCPRRGGKTEDNHIVACLDEWLLIADPHTTTGRQGLQFHLQLLNPITSAAIALPRRRSKLANLLSAREDIMKAVLSSPPNNVHVDCHVIVLLYSSPYLAWCKVMGEGCGWKKLSNEIFETQPKDVSYYGETLYVMDSNNVYVVRDLIVTSSHREPSVRAVSLSSILVSDCPWSYTFDLAPDLAGQLLVICSFRGSNEVNKLVVSSSSGEYKWEKVRSLDGYALFLGTRQSFSLPASDDHNGVVMANRIYYPDRVFNLEFGCFAPFDDPYSVVKIQRGSFWFLPMHRDVIGEHIRSKKGVRIRNLKLKVFSYGTESDSKVCKGNKFQALLSMKDDG